MGKNRAYYSVFEILGYFWCLVVFLVTFSNNLNIFHKNKLNKSINQTQKFKYKNLKKSMEYKEILKYQKKLTLKKNK